MKAFQAHYTSCRRGSSGHSGFQLRAHSEGIDAKDLAEIEARNGYRPPLDAPTAPTEEELAQAFPVALRSYRLPSGILALTRAVYSGRDYSGRWGNFFAHSLIFDPAAEDADLGWPIDYFEWEGWVGRLTPEEDTDVLPAPLPGVDLARIEKALSFTWAELALFLGEEKDRPALLAAMGEALLRGLDQRRPVVVRAPSLDLPYWLACLQKLLPRPLAWDLTISTYEDEPLQNAQLAGTSGQTYFSFDDNELKFRIYGFDFVDHRRSDVETIGRYPSTAAAWLGHQPASLERYFRWLDSCGTIGIADLEPSLDLFRLLEGEDRALDLNTDNLLGFASRFTLDVLTLSRIFEALVRLGKLETRRAEDSVYRFLAEKAVPLDPGLASRILDAWLARAVPGWLDEAESAELFESFWRSKKARQADVFALAARRWVVDWKSLKLPATDFGSQKLLHFMLAVGAVAGRSRIWREDPAAELFKKIGLQQTGRRQLFELAGRDGADLLDLLDLLGRSGSESDRELGRALGGAMAAWPEAPAIREALERAGAWQVLFGEWLGRLEACSDAAGRAAALASYERQELTRLKGFRAKAWPWIRWTVLAEGPARLQLEAIHKWLTDGVLADFPADLFRQCIDSGQRWIPWDIRDRNLDDLARLLVELTSERRLRVAPDRARLRLAFQATAAANLGKRNLDGIFAALEGADPEEELRFLSLFLAKILPAVDKEGHEKLLAALEDRRSGAAAPEAYGAALRKLDSENLLKLGRYWLQSRGLVGLRQKIGKTAEDVLIDWLAAHPADLELAEEKFPRLRDAQPTWDRWQERIGRRRRNPLVRLKSWCHGLIEKLPFGNRN